MKFKVHRYNPDTTAKSYVQDFDVESRPGLTVLDALIQIRDEQDGTLGMRYSCRSAVCGSCSMRINGKPMLACRTLVEQIPLSSLTIEPLPFFPVKRDLVVDLKSMFKNYAEVEPWLQPASAPPAGKEYRQSKKNRAAIDPYENCIMCGNCYGVCPVFKRTDSFLGPAALAKHHQKVIDERDGAKEQRLAKVATQEGVYGCDNVFECVWACPKGVPPTLGIMGTRRKINVQKVKKLFHI